jgi:hypothetical protein
VKCEDKTLLHASRSKNAQFRFFILLTLKEAEAKQKAKTVASRLDDLIP